jgi:hypothetical protein
MPVCSEDGGQYLSSIIEQGLHLADQPINAKFRFQDMMAFINERYKYIYKQMANVDKFFYGEIIQVTDRVFNIPMEYSNALMVFEARDKITRNREVYSEASNREIESPRTFSVEGRRVHIWGVGRTTYPIWIVLLPLAPTLSFPMYNRDFKILKEAPLPKPLVQSYQFYDITYETSAEHPEWENFGSIVCTDKRDSTLTMDFGEKYNKLGKKIVSWIIDEAAHVCFISYEDLYTHDWESHIINNFLCANESCVRYNAFDYMGRGTHAKFLDASFNEYTGMGVVVQDKDDNDTIKQTGCFVDTYMNYPSDVGINLLVAQIGQKWALQNQTQKPVVLEALASAKTAFEKYCDVQKASWQKVQMVNPVYPWNGW